MLIIAIDLGKFNSVACLYNTQTQKQQFDKRSQPIAGSSKHCLKPTTRTWLSWKLAAPAVGSVTCVLT